MLEGGADVRFVQELLGHSSLESTQIYTHVSISKLKAVYEACHPSANATTPVAAVVTSAEVTTAEVEVDE
jgi:hypothetical protein